MEFFEKKVKEIKNQRIPLIIFILLMAFIIFVFAIIEIIPKNVKYVEFSKDKKSGNFVKAKVYYLMGPLVQVKNSKDGIISGYYVAVGEEDVMFIIKLKEDNIEIPILGKDIDDESTESLEGKEILGNAQLISSSLRNALNSSFNLIYDEEIANNNSFEEVFGGYYLDTVIQVPNIAIKLFILCAFITIIGVLSLVISKRIRKNVDQTIKELKLKGKLEEVIKEFESEKSIKYKRLKVYLSTNYIFSYCFGLDIIAFEDIEKVTISKKAFLSSNKNKYIIITTKDNIEHYIAPLHKKMHKFMFNELLAKIKSKIQ